MTYITPKSQSIAVKLCIHDNNIEWTTDVIFSRNETDSWVGVKTFREALHPVSELPEARKPIIVLFLVNKLKGSHDGILTVTPWPHYLTNNDIYLASEIINGTANCRLPTVYISAKFNGGHAVDCNAVAHDLSGMAHIVVEPNRAFSTRLKINVNSKNAYGGAIAIYWPDGSGRRLFFPEDIGNESQTKKIIIEEIRSALMFRRPLFRCTWTAIEQLLSQSAIEKLKSEKSTNLDEYISHFDNEIKILQQQKEESEREIGKLNSEIRKLKTTTALATGVNIIVSEEQEFFDGEFKEIIIDALNIALKNTPDKSRRESVLRSAINSNFHSDILRFKKESVKDLLRDYKSMSKNVNDGLLALGFDIYEEGKHYKIIYNEDDRYTFSLSKTSSDHRGGLNLASALRQS